MLAFIKRILGLTPKTPEQRAFAEFNDLMEVMREHYCLEVHGSYEMMIDTFEISHESVDREIIRFYTGALRLYLSEVGGFYY